MSESNDLQPSTSHGDDNVLDDLMQNNVLFEEDEKPKETLISEASDKEDGENNDDDDDDDDDSNSEISEEEHDEEKPKGVEEEKSPRLNRSNDHSDISEDEEEPREKRSRHSSGSSSEDEDKAKRPSLASRITRPEPTQVTPKKKKGKSYDYATKLNYLFRDARFFLVKSSVAENIDISKARGVWSTPPANEGRFNKAFKESRNVLMIFSVKESGKFCGFARLSSESRRDVPSVPWVLPPGLSARALGSVFKIDWICRKDLSFQKVTHLQNPWNDNKPVKIGRDGQEIEPSVAENVCRLFPVDNGVDMTPILRRSKESARLQRLRPENERNLDIPNTRPLAERARPVLSGGGENRKRSYRDAHHYQHYEPSRPKYKRPNHRDDYHHQQHPAPPRRYHHQELQRGRGHHQPQHHHAKFRHHQPNQRYRGSPSTAPVSRSYEEYLRSVRPSSSSNSRPRYHAQEQDYLYERRSSRPSYERSVDDFIRRNHDRRYRDRR